jgi:two-component system, NarL family, nitrate/nitrite response regulator NarL
MTSKENPPKAQISILLAHRYTLTRKGLIRILQDADFLIAGEADSVEELHRLTARLNPSLVLLDWYLSENPSETIQTLIEQTGYQGAIVLISRPQTPEYILSVIQVGAKGCLSLNLTSEEFVSRLHMLARGDFVISHELAPKLDTQMVAVRGGSERETREDLSERELEVLTLVSRGATNREIAEDLTITENTVKVHLRHILEKLDLRNRQQAAAYAVQEGLVRDVGSSESEEESSD